MSILFHATPRRNLASIYRLGVSPEFARCVRQECWFCTGALRAWAVEHVAERHNVPPSEIVLVRVSVRRDALTFRGKGKWTCRRAVKSILSVSLPCAA